MDALQILKDKGFKPYSDLNYCLENGIEYYIGQKGTTAAIAAFIIDEDNYMIDKSGLREMVQSAKHYEIKRVVLFTNYGLELHSKETYKTVGLNKIEKILRPY